MHTQHKQEATPPAVLGDGCQHVELPQQSETIRPSLVQLQSLAKITDPLIKLPPMYRPGGGGGGGGGGGVGEGRTDKGELGQVEEEREERRE